MFSSQFLRVYANETRGSTARAKSHCKYCGKPITWFVTVANAKAVPLDGHEPVPVRSERDDDNRTIEIHDKATVHFETCDRRPSRSASAPKAERSFFS